MYNEYPDLVLEGLISDSFYTDIVEEGLGESIKNGFGKLGTTFKTFINKVIEKWKWILGKIKDGIKKIKEKFKKNNNTTSSSSTPANVKATVKYKFKSKDYIKEFDSEYEKISQSIKDMIFYVECINSSIDTDYDKAHNDSFDAYRKLAKYGETEYPKTMEELKEKLLDLSEQKESYEIDSDEIKILMETKPDKYTDIIDKINILLKDAEVTMEYFKSLNAIEIDSEKKRINQLLITMYSLSRKFMGYMINYASLILEQITSFKNE